ncbi:hypothetical protein P0W48_08185 [Plesiomonas shigelloides]|uniref:hypothetical protein n=1 Tax=Plesiomonas shigelloides TaxID=703 RepID=UPI0010581EC6|nr:hypothetical protein [Plesiomonas shigelloides]
MKINKIVKSLLVDVAGTFLAIYMIGIATPVIFQKNELLGLFSLFVTVAGTRVCMQKICSISEWSIKALSKDTESRS